MTLQIVADENIPGVERYFGCAAQVRRVDGRALRASQLKDADILLVRSVTTVDASLLHKSAIRFVGTATSGTEHVDQQWLRAQGIDFAHAPGSNANSVVEYLLAAIAASEDTLERLMRGATVGVIGYGVIGKQVVQRLLALGIECCVYDPWLAAESLYNPASLGAVLACEVITVHCELTRQRPWPSFHLLGEAELAGLQAGQLLINASRGAVIDNRALLERLQRSSAPTVVLDVWEGEPRIAAALLDKVALGTAHIAGYSIDGKFEATRMLTAAVADFLNFNLPEIEHPAGEPPTLNFDTHWEGAELIRRLIMQRYDIYQDDHLLRSAMVGPQSAAQFDQLRKNYAPRRELSGSQLRQVTLNAEQQRLLRGLNCSFAGTQVTV